ncbi:alkaline phosphatase PhoX [Agaribacterium sp. ZY112]|uniref:alkaline phosphatase PhoX n=1 Tax=Agaribacterium sp. ZY112 TaxID=3233574 RepID=UPI0035243B0A
MRTCLLRMFVGAATVAVSQLSFAGTDIYFNPLTQSSSVASPNHINELNGPWRAPAGISQENLTSMAEIEADANQSVVRAPGASTSASMWDMVAFDPTGEYIFIPHESPFGAGVSRYSVFEDSNVVLFSGDGSGVRGEPGTWDNDYGAFDPARFTPMGTVITGEEWSGEGRVIEILNPMAEPKDIEVRELDSFANVSHEGIMFSKAYANVVYYVDEYNSGSIYKLVLKDQNDLSKGGQTFVLSVNDFNGEADAMWNDDVNLNQPRTGRATWVAITDKNGKPSTKVSPFKNGISADPRSNPDTFGGRIAADEVNATPFGRPEDVEVGLLANGREVLYVAVTSEKSVYTIEMRGKNRAKVRILASEDHTPKNKDFPATTGVLNSPDNLAQDALGNIYIIEDAPNSSDVGGDIWFVRDVNSDGVAESLDHFLSIQVDGAEATGMIFNPELPTEFVVAVQHPDSTNLDNVENGFGDALWRFDVSGVVPPVCQKYKKRYWWSRVRTCSHNYDSNFVRRLAYSAK